MKKTNGFIATSLLYSFFLAFVTIFVAMIAIYLQNRVYLNKLEDSSKKSIYIREMKESLDSGSYPIICLDKECNEYYQFSSYDENNFYDDTAYTTCNLSTCETINYNAGSSSYYGEGCACEEK